MEKLLEGISITAKDVTSRNIYLTLVALFVLQEEFEDKKDEWKLIAKKAKNFLSNQVKGLSVKPDKVVQKFSL